MMAFSIRHYKDEMELRERLDHQVKLVAEQKAQLKILREQVALLQAHEMEEHGGTRKINIFFAARSTWWVSKT